MGRPRNVDIAGSILHAGSRGHNRQQIFHYEMEYLEYLTRLQAALVATGCLLIAYCLMPNHAHLVVLVRRDGGLGKLMRIVGAGYARSYNRRHQRSGALFEGRYWMEHVITESQLANTHLYVEANPVVARLADRPDEWPWSSAGFHLAGRSDVLLGDSTWFNQLGITPELRQAAYVELMDDYLRIQKQRRSTETAAELVPRSHGSSVDG